MADTDAPQPDLEDSTEITHARRDFASEYQDARRTLLLVAVLAAGQDEAEDVLQEALIIAMRKYETYKPGTNFTAWMRAIIRAVAANHRRAKHRRFSHLRSLWSTRRDRSGSRTGSPSQRDQLDPQLRTAIDQLPDEQRFCLLLKVVLTHSYKEISEIVGIPETTARSHVFRARQRLMDLLPAPEGDSDA